MAADGVDPWVVQPRERARYEEQFKTLNPINGIITGQQARTFLMQSQLPVDVLGQIWSLADIDSDGRLDINEFSIACKLINLKLRGFPIPTALPHSLRALTLQSPVISSQTPFMPPVKPPPPVIPPQPIMPHIPPQPIMPQIPPQPFVMQQPIIPPQPALIPNFPMAPIVPPQPSLPGVGMTPVPPVIPPQPSDIIMPSLARPSLTGISSIPPLIGGEPVISAQGTPVDASKILDRRASNDSLGSIMSPGAEWGVPHASKLKHTQLFNTHDRTRTGFLSAMQARSIMVATQLPQKTLAQIWSLSDTDGDGKLSCEEFVLAMHLCDMAKEGKPMPATLPLDLVPPAMRRRRASSITLADDKSDITFLPGSGQASFEDKRKENFDKGQAELDRRRATLLDQQRKEREERERKEREEEERREQLRLEQEARRQAELQDQLQKQRELEQLQEEQRRRAQEQREAARKEAERLRLEEWENARTVELETQRQREQETVLRLKARNQTLAIELSSLTGKVKDLSSKITETRAGVAAVKSTIDGMRTTRDTHMSDMSALKTKLKEQNQRLLLLTQEKAKLEAKNKASAAVDVAATEQARQAFTNKQITIKHLNEKIAELQKEVDAKTQDLEHNKEELKQVRGELKNKINSCETLYETYADKRDAVLQLKAASKGSWGAPQPAWDSAPVADSWNSAPTDAWGSEPSWAAAPAQDEWAAPPVSSSTTSDTHHKYRALFEFSSRNPDELTFMPGDIIMVPVTQNAEPGWLMGELQGKSGWFPESYVEPVDSLSTAAVTSITAVAAEKQPLEGILEVPEAEAKIIGEELSERYEAVYPYQSAEVGDLTFEQGEQILVIKKEGDWWTGVIGDRTGIFPSNYVQPIIDSQMPQTGSGVVSSTSSPPVSTTAAPLTPTPTAPSDALQDSDDVFMQSDEKAKSPIPPSGTVSGRETPADVERIKPATPDFSTITAAQTKMGKKGEIATVIAPYKATSSEQLSLTRGQLVCIRKRTTTGWWEGELQAKGKKKQVGWFPASYVKLMNSRRLSQTTPDFEAEMNAQKVVAMFAYKAQNEDELSFEKDDVIQILSRDDAAWWKGELHGALGLFPSNYVMPLDSQLSTRLLDGEERLRQEAIHELVDSERAYVNDMAAVRVVFEKPLIRSGLVTKEQIGRIFLNWREILKGNNYLLKALDGRKVNGIYECVGDVLCDNLPRMIAYIRFCSCQLSAGALLQQLTESSIAFRELCRQCQRDPRTQGLPLSTFLIKPMQRITKYSLLITKILDHTPKSHPDRGRLEEALKCAEELCSQVNEGVREQENAERLEWLQSHVMLDGLEERLVFNSLTKRLGPRKLLHYGCLTKTRSGKELCGFILSDFILLAQPMKPLLNGHFTLDTNSNLVFKLYKKPLLVDEITIEKTADSSDRSFILTFPKGQCGLTASSVNEVTNWVKHIKSAKAKATAALQDPTPAVEKNGPAVGRLLVEVMEVVDFDAHLGNLVCEMQVGSQRQNTTPTSGPPFKFNMSTQFLVRQVKKEIVHLNLVVYNKLSPDVILERCEMKLSEMLEHTQSAGPVLRTFALKQYGNAQLHVKFDLVMFH